MKMILMKITRALHARQYSRKAFDVVISHNSNKGQFGNRENARTKKQPTVPIVSCLLYLNY